jgi:HAD superfamily hydrolase (TIGR01509 family)
VIVHLPFESALFDLDGTLIDSNAAHATAWMRALREHGFPVEILAVRQLIGMGGDKLLPALAGIEETSPQGRSVVRRKKELFAEQLPWLRPMPGARALLEFLIDQRIDVVIATSADAKEMAALLDRAGVADLACKRASKDDAAESKPDPDIVCAALAKAHAGAESAIMVGDTPYDIEAAARAGLPSVALRCGGHWTDHDLRGALYIFDDPADLLERWKRSASSAGTLRRRA